MLANCDTTSLRETCIVAPHRRLTPTTEPVHAGGQERPLSRIRAPDYSSERQHFPGPAVLVFEGGLPLLDRRGPLPSGGACWHGANGGVLDERERDRERERERRDERAFQANSYGPPPLRLSSQLQSASNHRPASPGPCCTDAPCPNRRIEPPLNSDTYSFVKLAPASTRPPPSASATRLNRQIWHQRVRGGPFIRGRHQHDWPVRCGFLPGVPRHRTCSSRHQTQRRWAAHLGVRGQLRIHHRTRRLQRLQRFSRSRQRGASTSQEDQLERPEEMKI